MDEGHPVAPVDPNGVNKAAGESYHLVYGRVYGLATCVLRLTNTYGPRMRVKDDRQTFLGTWLRLAVEGDELAIFGDGRQRRDFTYVDDAVDAFLLAGARPEADGEIFNLGGDPPIGASGPRRARGRGRRRRLVPARSVPGRARIDRHRRLLRGRLEDPDDARLGAEGAAPRGAGAVARLLPRACGGVLVTGVPFLDLGRQAAAQQAELEDAFATVLGRGRFVGGPSLEAFEAEFAAYCGVEHAVGVNSGTDAIALALRALGIGPGDEVITAANTCVATITGIVGAGATPVLADVDEETWTLDPASAEQALSGGRALSSPFTSTASPPTSSRSPRWRRNAG